MMVDFFKCKMNNSVGFAVDFRWKPISFIFKEETLKGKRHVVVDQIELDPTTSFLYMDFQNLFNGDKLLGNEKKITNQSYC